MTHPYRPQSKNDVDIAYEVLMVQGRPMYYYDIIKEVLNRKQIPLDPLRISEILTQINLDARFNYVGKSEWGLRVWTPSKGVKKLANVIPVNKHINEEDDDFLDEEIIYDEEIVDDDLEKDEFLSESNNDFDSKEAIF